MIAKRDEELIKEIQNGNILSFEVLVRRYQRGLSSFVHRITNDWHSSEEIVQDSFLALYTHIAQVDQSRKFSTYLFAIAKNKAFSHLRSKRVHQKLDETIVSEDETLYEELFRFDTQEMVKRALAAIDQKYFAVIELYYFKDLSYEEIGKKLHLPINTVRTHLFRAKEVIKGRLSYENY